MRSTLLRYADVWKPLAFGAYLLCVLHAMVPHVHPGSDSSDAAVHQHDQTPGWMDRLGLIFHTDLGSEHLEYFLKADQDGLFEADLAQVPVLVPHALPRIALEALSTTPQARRFGEGQPPPMHGRSRSAPDTGRAPPLS